MVKYGMNMLLWASDLTEEHMPLFGQLKEIGYDGVEVPIFDIDEAKFARIGEELKKCELGATAVTVCAEDANPISPDAAVRKAAIEHLKQAVDMCTASGATHLCGPIHSTLGQFSGAGPTEDERSWCKEVLSNVGDYAKANNVTLVVEYLNRFECYFLNTAADAARLCREIDHPNVRTMYDTFHANIEEKSITEAVKACSEYLVHVHISENDRSTPGAGGVNWDESFAALKESGYDNGYLTIEAFGLALPDLAAATMIWRRMFSTEMELAKQGLEFMKSRWEG